MSDPSEKSRLKSCRVFVVAAVAILAAASPVLAQTPLEPLVIETSSGTHSFAVEVMRSRDDLARGLMFRRALPTSQGMLFEYLSDRPLTFWMKNTIIPLDIIFVARNGQVVSIAENATPMSEAVIPSGASVAAALEINAGVASEIGLKPGDLVRNVFFSH